MLTGRQRKILQLLFATDNYLTAAQIASEIGCSVKTVRNDLQAIDRFISSSNQCTIETRPNRGILLHHEGAISEHLLQLSDESISWQECWGNDTYSLLFLLLKRQSITIEEIKKNIFASRSVAEKKLAEMEQWLHEQNIMLQRRRGQGIYILYREIDYRIAMLKLWNLFYKKLLDADHNNDLKMRQRLNALQLKSIELFLDGFDATLIGELIGNMEQQFGFQLNYESYTRMLFLLSVTIFRSRKKHFIKEQFVPLPDLNQPEREIAQMIEQWIEENYKIKFSEYDCSFLHLIIRVSEIERFNNHEFHQQFITGNSQLNLITRKIIARVGEVLCMDFSGDKLLEENLMISLRSIITWLQVGIRIRHTLLDQIRHNYARIYVAVWSTGPLFEKETGLSAGNDEFNLMALHFINAIEHAEAKVRVAIICNYGKGITQYIREEIERSVFGIKVVASLSTRDIEMIREVACDFLISLVPISNPYYGREVVYMTNFAFPLDTNNIQAKVAEIRQRKIQQPSIAYSQSVRQLFLPEQVFLFPAVNSKEELLSHMCSRLECSGLVTPEYSESTMKREKISSTYIGKSIALPHGAPQFVIRPVIAVAILKKAIIWENNEWVRIVFLLAINMEEQFMIKQDILKFYSLISMMLNDVKLAEKLLVPENEYQLAEMMNQMLTEI